MKWTTEDLQSYLLKPEKPFNIWNRKNFGEKLKNIYQSFLLIKIISKKYK